MLMMLAVDPLLREDGLMRPFDVGMTLPDALLSDFMASEEASAGENLLIDLIESEIFVVTTFEAFCGEIGRESFLKTCLILLPPFW